MTGKNQQIQIMRGLAITIVLIRHAIAQVNTDVVLDAVEDIIICFHMPVFFMIAGFLFQRGLSKYLQKGKGQFIIGKAKHLMLPYLFWTLLLWMGVQIACMTNSSVLEKMTDIGFAPMSMGNLIYGLLTYQVYYTEHLWFLYVLFVLFLINIYMAKSGDTRVCLIIWLSLGFLTRFVTLPHIIERTMEWGVFFSFGRYIQANNITKKMSGGGYSVCIYVTFIVASIVRVICLKSGITGVAFSFFMQLDKYIIGFVGVGVIYFIAHTIVNSSIGKAFKCIGDYSFDIYLMHNPYCVAFSTVVMNGFFGISSYATVILATALGIAIPMIVSRFVIRKNRLLSTIMIGR